MECPPFYPQKYRGKVFRNIFTNASGQHILHDICDEKDLPLVEPLIQLTSGIDHQQPPCHRPFQYSKIEDEQILAVFKKENWNYGRFGDGKSYGVWYGAEEEETSVLEACWISYRLAKDNVSSHHEVYVSERAMYSAQIQALYAIDLTKEENLLLKLIHPIDYGYCQTLGQKIFEGHYQMLKTPSARRRNGICTPIFSPDPIKNTHRIYYLKINVYPDGQIGVDSSQDKVRTLVKASTLLAPYDDQKSQKDF